MVKSQRDYKWFRELTGYQFSGEITARSKSRTPPLTSIDDEPYICLIANRQWWAHIAGVVDTLTERRAWDVADDDNSHAIQQILQFLEGVSCMEFQLRQSPIDPCILEQSLDGGQTWTLAYDFLLCENLGQAASEDVAERERDTDQLIQDAENALQNYNTNYVDSVGDLYPFLVYDGSQADGDRDRALCFALTEYIDAISEGAIRYYDEIEEDVIASQRALATAAAALAVLAIVATGGGALFAAGLLGAAAATLGLGGAFSDTLYRRLNNATVDQFEDLAARQTVVCGAYDLLKGKDVDRGDLIDAFNPVLPDANAEAIQNIASLYASQDVFYAVFVDKMAYGMAASPLGLLPGCPCETELSVWEWDFVDGLGNFKLINGTVESDGVHGVKSGDPIAATLELLLPAPIQLREVTVSVTRVDGVGNGSDDEDTVRRWSDRAGTLDFQTWIGVGGAGNGVYDRCSSSPVPRSTSRMIFNFEVSDINPTRDIIIRKVKLVMESPAALGKIDADYILC